MTRWVLVVEDDARLGAMICDNLRFDGRAADLVGDGDSALERLSRARFDLVVLDVMLPRRDGLSVLREMRRRGDRTPVLVLSARASDQDRISGLELEADDYLGKPFHLRELLLRVDALLRRAPPPPAVAADGISIGGNHIDFRGQSARTWRGRQVRLTRSELHLLHLLAARRGDVVSRREVVAHLFGADATPVSRTVDNLVARLRRHLEPEPSAPRHLLTVRGQGWRLATAAEEERSSAG